MTSERLSATEGEALEEFRAMTREDVAARAAAFAAAEDPLGLGHAAAGERWSELERAMVAGDHDRVRELPERELQRWVKRLNALSRAFASPDPAPVVAEEPQGLPGEVGARATAVSALGRSRDPRQAGTLAAVLRSDDAPTIRASAARGLALVGGEGAVDALLGVDAEDAWVRGAIATALGVLGDPRAVPRLIAWLDDRRIRSEVAEALGRIGDPLAVPALAELLESGSWTARFWARSALVEMGRPEAVEALRRADRGLVMRWLRLRAARRAVARRAAPTFHPMARRNAVSAVKELCLGALVVLLPVLIVGSDDRVFVVAALVGVIVTVLFSVSDRRERDRALGAARGAQRRPAASPWATVADVFAARPHRAVGVLIAALVLEWATGGAGYAAGVVAGPHLAVAVDRLLLARLASRWQRERGVRL